MGRKCRRGTAVPTSEMKISKSAERGKGRGWGERKEGGRKERGRGEKGVWCCCTLCDPCDFLDISSTSPVFAIRPPSEAEGDAPSRVAPSRTLGLTPKATKRGGDEDGAL